MSPSAKELLSELRKTSDPSVYLANKYNTCTDQEKRNLNKAIGELERAGLLTVFWADNIAYNINLRCENNDTDSVGSNTLNESETVLIIGDNNKIKNSSIGINNGAGGQGKKRFWENHPFALALITAIIAAFIMMFSFWGKIVAFIEGMFS